MLSPAILGELQSRNNRSSFQSLPISANLNRDLNSHSILNNVVDKTSKGASYHVPRSYPYNRLYKDSSEELEGSEANEQLDESLQDGSYLQQEQPNFYKSYDFSANNDNFDETSKSSDNIDASIANIQESSTNLYPSYHGAGLPKAAFPYGPFIDKPYGGFHGFHGPYGHHHYRPYGGGSSEENSGENNGTNYQGYGSPYFGDHQPYPNGGYGNYDSFYGPYQRNGNDTSGNGRNGYGPYGYGPYHGGSDFYGPPGYGYNYGYNGNNNSSNNGNTNSRQTEETTDNGDQNNSTKNGYSPPYGPPWVKPLGGIFHPHGFPFNPLPYDHFHGAFKGGPVVGVGHVGYPIYADPYLAGFPFHHLYGPPFYGKKYVPPRRKPPADSGETTEAPAGIMETENPERITMLNVEEVAPAPSSNRYKISGKESKRINRVNFESRKI